MTIIVLMILRNITGRRLHQQDIHQWGHQDASLSPYSEINQIHESHNTPVPYLTAQHFETEMCTILFQNNKLQDMDVLWNSNIGLFIA